MNRIDALFQRKRDHVLNIYFTAGFPSLADTPTLLLALDKAGVDLVEVGMPYSDPLADGPTIQESGQVALKNGMNLALLFEQIKQARAKTELPIILMGYFNQVMQYGEEAFFRQCKSIGVDGLILPDLPLDIYRENYQALLTELDLGISFLVTPQTSEERIREIDALSRGFVYVVADASITGSQSGISTQQTTYFEHMKNLQLNNPQLIGFGIADHQSFELACRYANGAIIGSAFIRMLKKERPIDTAVAEFIAGIRQTTTTISK